LEAFRYDYADAVQCYIDYLWTSRIQVDLIDKKDITKTNIYIFDVQNRQYDLLDKLSNVGIDITTELSGRALKAALTQAIGIVQSSTAKYKKKEYAAKVYNNQKVKTWLEIHKPTKPVVDKEKLNPELDSNCCIFQWNENIDSIFECYVVLSSLYKIGSSRKFNLIDDNGEITNQIVIPIKLTSRSNYWSKKGKMMSSFIINRRFINIRWKVEVDKNKSKIVVGADIGQTTAITLSDASITPKCPHGHDLKSINAKMARQKKGGKAFNKSQKHRVNYVNWSVKQLNLGQYKEIRLESNKNIKYKNSTSKSLRHWSWTEIHKSIVLVGEELDVSIQLQPSSYKSQRCFSCGWVQKGNRVGKRFTCNQCSHTDDADVNGAKNNTVDLPVISKSFRDSKPNKEGFYWLETGTYTKSEYESNKRSLP
jgi:transposase